MDTSEGEIFMSLRISCFCYDLVRCEMLFIAVSDPVNNITIYMNGKSSMRDDPRVYINWAYLIHFSRRVFNLPI